MEVLSDLEVSAKKNLQLELKMFSPFHIRGWSSRWSVSSFSSRRFSTNSSMLKVQSSSSFSFVREAEGVADERMSSVRKS